MGIVLHLQEQSRATACEPQCPERRDEILGHLGAVANGIVMMNNNSATMVRCIVALRASLEAFEGIHGAIADSDEHEQFLRRTRLIDSRLQSELTKLASILRATRCAAEQALQSSRPVG